jgi:AHBA synthesis associated protein
MSVGGEELAFSLAVFDMDGTIVDDVARYASLAALRFRRLAALTDERVAREWAHIGGYDPDTGEVNMGGPIAKASRREDAAIAAAAVCLRGVPWHEARAIAERAYNEADSEQLRDYTPRIFPGVEDALRKMKYTGFILCVATNGQRKVSCDLLEVLDLSNLFPVVVGSEDVSDPKPAPDMLLRACQLSGVSPGESVYFGDQPTDAEAARAAGYLAAVTVGKTRYTPEPFREIAIPSIAYVETLRES